MNTLTHGNDIRLVQTHIARAFDLSGPLELLSGGEGRTYRAGNTVYRRETDTIEAAYLAEVYHTLPEAGFRVPKPIPTKQGTWISPDGWSAWTFVAGGPATTADVPSAVAAVAAFHRALAHQPYPSYLAQRATPFDRADQAAWGKLPDDLDPQLVPFVTQLQRLRHPVPARSAQLIHGDLNEENILIAPGHAPAIIDLTPYWRPPAFALAVLAYWLGPYRGDMAVLAAFASVPDFDQMLVRVGLRTMLIAHEFSQLGSLEDTATTFATPVAIIETWLAQRPRTKH